MQLPQKSRSRQPHAAESEDIWPSRPRYNIRCLTKLLGRQEMTETRDRLRRFLPEASAAFAKILRDFENASPADAS